jgi:hypothetical protein
MTTPSGTDYTPTLRSIRNPDSGTIVKFDDPVEAAGGGGGGGGGGPMKKRKPGSKDEDREKKAEAAGDKKTTKIPRKEKKPSKKKETSVSSPTKPSSSSSSSSSSTTPKKAFLLKGEGGGGSPKKPAVAPSAKKPVKAKDDDDDDDDDDGEGGEKKKKKPPTDDEKAKKKATDKAKSEQLIERAKFYTRNLWQWVFKAGGAQSFALKKINEGKADATQREIEKRVSYFTKKYLTTDKKEFKKNAYSVAFFEQAINSGWYYSHRHMGKVTHPDGTIEEKLMDPFGEEGVLGFEAAASEEPRQMWSVLQSISGTTKVGKVPDDFYTWVKKKTTVPVENKTRINTVIKEWLAMQTNFCANGSFTPLAWFAQTASVANLTNPKYSYWYLNALYELVIEDELERMMEHRTSGGGGQKASTGKERLTFMKALNIEKYVSLDALVKRVAMDPSNKPISPTAGEGKKLVLGPGIVFPVGPHPSLAVGMAIKASEARHKKRKGITTTPELEDLVRRYEENVGSVSKPMQNTYHELTSKYQSMTDVINLNAQAKIFESQIKSTQEGNAKRLAANPMFTANTPAFVVPELAQKIKLAYVLLRIDHLNNEKEEAARKEAADKEKKERPKLPTTFKQSSLTFGLGGVAYDIDSLNFQAELKAETNGLLVFPGPPYPLLLRAFHPNEAKHGDVCNDLAAILNEREWKQMDDSDEKKPDEFEWKRSADDDSDEKKPKKKWKHPPSDPKTVYGLDASEIITIFDSARQNLTNEFGNVFVIFYLLMCGARVNMNYWLRRESCFHLLWAIEGGHPEVETKETWKERQNGYMLYGRRQRKIKKDDDKEVKIEYIYDLVNPETQINKITNIEWLLAYWIDPLLSGKSDTAGMAELIKRYKTMCRARQVPNQGDETLFVEAATKDKKRTDAIRDQNLLKGKRIADADALHLKERATSQYAMMRAEYLFRRDRFRKVLVKYCAFCEWCLDQRYVMERARRGSYDGLTIPDPKNFVYLSDWKSADVESGTFAQLRGTQINNEFAKSGVENAEEEEEEGSGEEEDDEEEDEHGDAGPPGVDWDVEEVFQKRDEEARNKREREENEKRRKEGKAELPTYMELAETEEKRREKKKKRKSKLPAPVDKFDVIDRDKGTDDRIVCLRGDVVDPAFEFEYTPSANDVGAPLAQADMTPALFRLMATPEMFRGMWIDNTQGKTTLPENHRSQTVLAQYAFLATGRISVMALRDGYVMSTLTGSDCFKHQLDVMASSPLCDTSVLDEWCAEVKKLYKWEEEEDSDEKKKTTTKGKGRLVPRIEQHSLSLSSSSREPVLKFPQPPIWCSWVIARQPWESTLSPLAPERELKAEREKLEALPKPHRRSIITAEDITREDWDICDMDPKERKRVAQFWIDALDRVIQRRLDESTPDVYGKMSSQPTMTTVIKEMCAGYPHARLYFQPGKYIRPFPTTETYDARGILAKDPNDRVFQSMLYYRGVNATMRLFEHSAANRPELWNGIFNQAFRVPVKSTMATLPDAWKTAIEIGGRLFSTKASQENERNKLSAEVAAMEDNNPVKIILAGIVSWNDMLKQKKKEDTEAKKQFDADAKADRKAEKTELNRVGVAALIRQYPLLTDANEKLLLTWSEFNPADYDEDVKLRFNLPGDKKPIPGLGILVRSQDDDAKIMAEGDAEDEEANTADDAKIESKAKKADHSTAYARKRYIFLDGGPKGETEEEAKKRHMDDMKRTELPEVEKMDAYKNDDGYIHPVDESKDYIVGEGDLKNPEVYLLAYSLYDKAHEGETRKERKEDPAARRLRSIEAETAKKSDIIAMEMEAKAARKAGGEEEDITIEAEKEGAEHVAKESRKTETKKKKKKKKDTAADDTGDTKRGSGGASTPAPEVAMEPEPVAATAAVEEEIGALPKPTEPAAESDDIVVEDLG